MNSNQDYLYSMKTIESIIANPDRSWRTVFKEMIISMIATNTNELLWYANFLSRCEYEFHFDESFVSSVYFNGKNFVIVVNPVILGVIHKDQIIAILKHSAGHIINHHFARGNYDKSINKEVIQTAKDIVINGCKKVPYIKDLPRTGSYKDSPIAVLFYQSLFQKYQIETYEVGREFEYYVELIQEALKEGSFEEAQDNNESSNDDLDNSSDAEIDAEPKSLSDKTLEALINGECKMDNHEYGQQLQEAVELNDDVFNSFMDSTLNEMIHDSTDFARGFTPGLATGVLSNIEKKNAHKDWKKILNKKMRNSFNNSTRYREVNKSRQHPIFQDDLDLYGYSHTKQPKLAVVLDVSGSVDDRLLSFLMSEIQAIQRRYSIKSLTLVQVDAEIKDIQKFGVRDKFIKRQGSGGTIMEPGFKALLEQSNREIPDMIICATDGDIEKKFKEVKIPNKVQVIWLLEEKGRLLFDVSQYPKQQMHVIKFCV
ncbi:MAG: VWA-like domain-containing protein [Sulfurimonas sp.]|nr:VWA-like domain-containing protein [Sulfurimonas sp.]